MTITPLSLLSAFLVAVSLCACKTHRTEKWSTKANEHQKLQQHFAGNFKLGQDESGNGRMVKLNADGSVDEDGGASIGNREFNGASTFKDGKRNVDKKNFNTGLFAGKKDVSRDSYAFLNARENSQKNSALQEKRFSGNDTQANESKKKWFRRDTSVEKKGFFSRRKKEAVATGDWYPAVKATEGNRGKQKPIITPPGTNTAPITLKDVKEMLGRTY